jgi:hypothetical protein
MGKTKWLMIAIVLALTMVMLWTVPTLAQMQGKGQRGQGWVCGQGPGQGQGQGQGYGNCPVYQSNQNSQGNWSNNPQTNTGPRGVRGGGRTYQPNTQPSAPPVTQ